LAEKFELSEKVEEKGAAPEGRAVTKRYNFIGKVVSFCDDE